MSAGSLSIGRYVPVAMRGRRMFMFRDCDRLGSGLTFFLDRPEIPWTKLDSAQAMRYDHALQMGVWCVRGTYLRTAEHNHCFIPEDGAHLLYCNSWGTMDNGELYPGHVLASKPGLVYQHRAGNDKGDFGFDYVVRPYVWPAPID